MLIIGHRGAPYEVVENSIESFERAQTVGAERIELDVQLSADKVPMVIHDLDLNRVTRRMGRLDQLTFPQIRENFRIYSDLFEEEELGGKDIPTLREVFEKLPTSLSINVEIKDYLASRVEIILKELESLLTERPREVIVSSFYISPLFLCKERLPKVEIAHLFDKPKLRTLASSIHRQMIDRMESLNCHILHPVASMVDQPLMDLAKSRKWKVIPYCELKKMEDPRDTKMWSRLQILGIDGLCTNYPRELKIWLSGKS